MCCASMMMSPAKLGDEGKAMDAVLLDFSEAPCPSQHPFESDCEMIRYPLRGLCWENAVQHLCQQHGHWDQGHPQQVCQCHQAVWGSQCAGEKRCHTGGQAGNARS